MSDKTKHISEIKDQLLTTLSSKVTMGIESIVPQDMAVITDAIKDLAIAEKSCYEAEYYKAVSEAMEESEDEPYSRDYYRPSRRMGYIPGTMYGNDTTGHYMDNAWRMEDRSRDQDANRYGRAFSEYRKARRNYTETHSSQDRNDMESMATRHLNNAIESIREMWGDADDTIKMRIKTDLSKLLGEMAV